MAADEAPLQLVPVWVTTPKDGFLGTLAYGMSKSANVLFTVAPKKRRLGKYGINSFAVDPGGEVRPSLDLLTPSAAPNNRWLCIPAFSELSA